MPLYNMLINDELYINESDNILSTIDPDEVTDDTISYPYNIQIEFTSNTVSVWSIMTSITEKINSVLSNEQECNRIEAFVKPEINVTENSKSVGLSFTSSTYGIDNLNDTLVKTIRAIIKKTAVSKFIITNDTGKIVCYLHRTAKHQEMSHSLELNDEFYNFYSNYDYSVSNEDILKSMLHSLIKYNLLFCLNKSTPLYSLYSKETSDDEFNNMFTERIVKKDGSFLTKDKFNNGLINFTSSGYSLVGRLGKYNYIDTSGNYLLDKWYTDATYFNNGIAVISDIYNRKIVIDTSGKPITEKTFSACDHDKISEGFMVVADQDDENKKNYLNLKTGKLLCTEYFNSAFEFKNGYATVFKKYGSEIGFIDTTGKYTQLPESIDRLDDFSEDIASVRLRNQCYSYIKSDGTFLLNNNNLALIECKPFHEGFGLVCRTDRHSISNGYNFIGKDGKLLYDNNEWFQTASSFSCGFAHVRFNNGTFNYIKQDGTFLYPLDDSKSLNNDFNSCWPFVNGFAKVYLKTYYKYAFIDTQGNLISNEYFDSVSEFSKDGIASVFKSNSSNILKSDGSLMSEEWFQNLGILRNGFINVQKKSNKKWNYIDIDGNFLLKNDMDYCYEFNERGTAEVVLDDQSFEIDNKGNIISYI